MKELLPYLFPVAMKVLAVVVTFLVTRDLPKLLDAATSHMKSKAFRSALSVLGDHAGSLAETLVRAAAGTSNPKEALSSMKSAAVGQLKAWAPDAVDALAKHGGLDAKAVDDLLAHLLHVAMPAPAAAQPVPGASQR